MYHDVMIQNQVWVIIPIPKCKKPINHEIQLLFKHENLLCVGVWGCVCVRPGIQSEDKNQFFTFKVRTF